jgi:putative ABC transport system permease protein
MNNKIQGQVLKPRWSKVFSDLWDDKTRTALVVASIAVGVFAVGMIITAFVVLSEDINRNYAAANPVNIELRTSPFYEDLVRVVEKMPGVDDVEGRQIIPIRARKAGDNWQGLALVGIKNLNTIAINQLRVIEGTRFPEKNEIIVSKDVINDTGFNVGDEVEVELPNGTTHNLYVAGIVYDQTTAKYDADILVNAFTSQDTLRSLGMGSYLNRLLVTVIGDGSDEEFIAEIAVDIEEKLESRQIAIFSSEENLSNEHPMAAMLLAMMGVLGALGILITLLSASLIINTLGALMTQQLRQIGVMKLIGAKSIQIIGMYLSLIVIYSVVALILAIPLGTIAGNELAHYISNLMGAGLEGIRVIPIAIAVQVLIAFLVPLGAGYFPVNKGAKTRVRRAISDYRPSLQSAGRSLINMSGSWVTWISRPILLSFRNTFRKKSRLILTILTLTIGGAVFIAVFNVRASMDNVMDQLMKHFLGDVTVSFSQPYNTSKVERDLMMVPGVLAVEGWGGAVGDILDINGDQVSSLRIVAPPADTKLLEPDMVDGRWLLPDEKKAMVISDTIYNFYPELKPGDQLMVEIGGNSEEAWEVVGIYRFVKMLGDPMAYANLDYVASKINLSNQSSSFRLTIDYAQVASVQDIIQQIDQHLQDRGYAVGMILDGNALRDNASTGVNILVIFLLIMALLTALVGSIGLMGTMSLNVLERTREIGVMRTIGAVDLVVMQSVIIEGLVIGIITWFLAIGLSYPISQALLDIIGQAMAGSTFSLVITPQGVFLWLAAVIVLSIIASVMPARNAARLTINEVLAYE